MEDTAALPPLLTADLAPQPGGYWDSTDPPIYCAVLRQWIEEGKEVPRPSCSNHI
ncbi:hypothetical protein ABZ883_41550 [Streptomyces sp. NPDC046977]|uniref:hypothetical protein n=1 Tax=Streptomyces sp. NPDC046977 TaxID=3154703 RepID=UPI0033DA7372